MTSNHEKAKDDSIAGGFYLRGTNGLSQTFLEITVESIDRCLQRVIANGGHLIKEKKPMLDFAYFAVVADSEGNHLGLWEDIPSSH